MSDFKDLLFDTNCLIDIYLGHPRIRFAFDDIVNGNISPFLSVITEADLWRGLRLGELEAHQILIEQFFVLPLQSDAARLAGSWMNKYQHDGLGWMDAFISATAHVNQISMLTRDKKLADILGSEVNFVTYE